MNRLAATVLLSASLLLHGAGGCSAPTSQFDALRGASASAVSGAHTLEVLE